MRIEHVGPQPWQQEFVEEALSWPEMPRVDRHLLTIMYGADMAPGVLAHAGATGIVFSERVDDGVWADQERFTNVFVHEWIHVFDANHLEQSQRNRLMTLSDVPERYTWRAQNERYYTRPVECFAAHAASIICNRRLGTGSINDRYYERMYEPLVRRYTMPMPDVQDKDDELIEAVGFLLANDITTGYPDGEFKPNRPVSRGEMARFLYRALKGSDE